MIERWLDAQLARTGLDPRQRLQASSHLAWGIVFPWVLGWWGLAAWIAWTLYKELHVDGHGRRLVRGEESLEQFVDLCWDLATRSAGAVLYVAAWLA